MATLVFELPIIEIEKIQLKRMELKEIANGVKQSNNDGESK